MIRLTGAENRTADIAVLKQNSVGETYPLHSHDFFEYFLVVGGRALHVVNQTTQLLKRGSLVLVRPDDEHCYKDYGSQSFVFLNVGIPRALIEPLDGLYRGGLSRLRELPLPRQVQLSEEETASMETALERLRAMPPGEERNAFFSLLLSRAFYFILTEDAREETHRIPEWMAGLLAQMEKEESFIAGLPRLLELSHYSQEHVNREFKRYLNLTPTQYINEKRLRFARHLLLTTSLSVTEICGRSGFQNISHFYTCYQKYFGRAPGEERK